MTNIKTVYGNQVATSTTGTSGTDAPSPGASQAWTVSSNAGFPVASNSSTPATIFHIADPSAPAEIITVTANPGTSWTVTRGAEGTTPVIHQAGATFYNITTSGDLANMIQAAGQGQSINPGTLSITNGSSGGGVFQVTNTTASPSAPNVEFIAALSTDPVLGIEVSGDADYRLSVNANGLLSFSSGAASADSTFGRVHAGSQSALESSVPVAVASGVTSSSLTGAVQFSGSDTTNYYPVAQDANGQPWDLARLTVVESSSHDMGPGANSMTFGTVSNVPSGSMPFLQPNVTYKMKALVNWFPKSGGPGTFQITVVWSGTAGTTNYVTLSQMTAITGNNTVKYYQSTVISAFSGLSITSVAGQQGVLIIDGIISVSGTGGTLALLATTGTGFTATITAGSFVTFEPVTQ